MESSLDLHGDAGLAMDHVNHERCCTCVSEPVRDEHPETAKTVNSSRHATLTAEIF